MKRVPKPPTICDAAPAALERGVPLSLQLSLDVPEYPQFLPELGYPNQRHNNSDKQLHIHLGVLPVPQGRSNSLGPESQNWVTRITQDKRLFRNQERVS